MEGDKKQKHVVLIHGAGHGAWCWYKVATLLRSRRFHVTALDMAASGVNTQPLSELSTYSDYSRPLMELLEALPPEESVVLVGHSMGGICISLAMEKFPQKIDVAVFVAASMPGPSLSIEEIFDQYKKQGSFGTDTKLFYSNGEDKPPTSRTVGPECLATQFYQLSPLEDLTLATLLTRPVGFFINNVEFSEENYGSVRRVYMIAEEDTKRECQDWMVQNNPPDEVKTIYGSDHMFMFSKPREFCVYLQDIVDKYC
ncbi:methyl jasmonate esterase 1-like [Primulina eburnea]|uniref:methyl jasmonate esterase 1-like n=1 Tax=Primulina eburnea TaxID=1245227 RepID=UPI003C6C7758